MNIARFTFSLALLGSLAVTAVAHKKGCSHDCKHESLHPTKNQKKSTSSHVEHEADKTKKIEIAESNILAEPKLVLMEEVVQTIAEPVTVTTVSTQVVTASAAVTPVENEPTLQIANAPAINEEAASTAEAKAVQTHEDAPKSVVATVEDKIEEATKDLNIEDKKAVRQLLADATTQDLTDIEDIAALLEQDELSLSFADTASAVEIKTAAAPAQEADAKETQQEINNLTQVMI